MTKLTDIEIKCEWCGNVQPWLKRASGGDLAAPTASSQKGKVASQVVCKKCGRYISQRRPDGTR